MSRRQAGDWHDEIREIVRARGVNQLLHFTLAANLPSILKEGLLPRRGLEKLPHDAYVVGEQRLDENPYAGSLSVERLNEKLLASKRYKCPGADWIVLILQPSIL